eukprot:gb/GFBE01026532.1/.p1 GENE.gb/GFBE01026532.1/~~gb/GFBE01026532.1/.p1  ORF type:complete len:257 (+),score=22.46 gb/GFBE01026532.1/:1-771(+)
MASQAVDWGWVSHAWQGPAGETSVIPKLGLVVLSTPLSAELLRHVWALTEKHVVADGGANTLHRGFPDLFPDVLVGDFDSAEPAIIEAYRENGVDVRDLSHDQDSTDLEKALSVVESLGCDRVLVAGKFAGVEGRLDHTFGVFNALHKFLSKGLHVALVSDDCCCFLLGPGEHEIHVTGAADSTTHCGLVPLGGLCESISTRGLQWDMEDASMQFGGLVSTSNLVDPTRDGPVWVRTSSPVLWMCDRPKFWKEQAR